MEEKTLGGYTVKEWREMIENGAVDEVSEDVLEFIKPNIFEKKNAERKAREEASGSVPGSTNIDFEARVVKTSFNDDMANKRDDIFKEALLKKGFTLDPWEVLAFINTRCKMTDDRINKIKTYYVNNKPFLLHRYDEQLLSHKTSSGYTLIASIGSFEFV